MATLGIALMTSQAHAISRYQSMRMSCDEVRSVIREEGAVILRWQSKTVANLPRYERFVSDSRFCSSNEITVFSSVPTRDSRACTVKKCEPYDPEDDFGGGRIIIPGR
ncbi:MAG: hypothetical protein AB7P20_17720 [Rhizobiaceae bacterium]